MQWTEEQLKKLPVINYFYFRGQGSSRLETFIDAAFAFAVTMLVISVGNVPKNYNELILALKGIPSFLASFAALALFWSSHRKWSRRYGLEDGKTIFLSFALIFVMLVYVYPLRLLFSAMFTWISGGWLPSDFLISHYEELFGLFIIYGVGFAAISSIIALLYTHAKSKKELLLTEIEIIITRLEVTSFYTFASCGLISAGIAWLMPPQIAAFAGFVYMLLPILMPLIARNYYKKVRLLKE